jgi:hypothetical protein
VAVARELWVRVPLGLVLKLPVLESVSVGWRERVAV